MWSTMATATGKQKSRLAQQLFSDKVPEVIVWPSNSRDANLVENLWSTIKRRVKKRKATNVEELNKFLHEKWVYIDVVDLNYLINSMK